MKRIVYIIILLLSCHTADAQYTQKQARGNANVLDSLLGYFKVMKDAYVVGDLYLPKFNVTPRTYILTPGVGGKIDTLSFNTHRTDTAGYADNAGLFQGHAPSYFQVAIGYTPVPDSRTVNGHALTSNVTVTKADIGLSNVDNTSDINKPVSSAQQTAIDAKVEDAINNGVTTIAPSQNAVFDAFALETLQKVTDRDSVSTHKITASNIKLTNVPAGQTNYSIVQISPTGDIATGNDAYFWLYRSDSSLYSTHRYVDSAIAKNIKRGVRLTGEGQSNEIGRGLIADLTSYPFTNIPDTLTNQFYRVYISDSFGTYNRLKIGVNNMANGSTAFGWELPAAIDFLLNNHTGYLFIDKFGASGAPISYFKKGGAYYTYYKNRKDSCNRWIVAHGFEVEDIGYGWWQGEANYTDNYATYKPALDSIFDDRIRDGIIPANTRLVIASIPTASIRYGAGVDSAFNAFVAQRPYARLINNANTPLLGDNLHYGSIGIFANGYPFYEKSADGDTLTVYSKHQRQKPIVSVAGVYGDVEGNIPLTKTDIGLSNVENTALSTWAGSTNITTLGAISTGTWNGTTIGTTKGGTGLTSYTLGDVPYASATNTLSNLSGNTTTTKKFLSQTGTGSASAAPAWSTVSSSDVGLSAVENTALSTWAGTSNITTLGTVSTGSWNATTIPYTKGGTGLTALGTANQVLATNAGGTAAEWQTISSTPDSSVFATRNYVSQNYLLNGLIAQLNAKLLLGAVSKDTFCPLVINKNLDAPTWIGNRGVNNVIDMFGSTGNYLTMAYASNTNGGNWIMAYRARGSNSAPTGLQTNHYLWGVDMYGHDGTSVSEVGLFASRVTENWTTTAHGNKAMIWHVINGTTTVREAFRADGTGSILLNPGGLSYPTIIGGSADIGDGSKLQVYGAATIQGNITTTGKLSITSGTNKAIDVAALSGGTVTVNNTSVTASSRIFVTGQSCSNCGAYYVTTITAGTSFVINSTNVLDASTVAYWIIN